MDIETWPWIRPFAELLNFGGNWLGLMQHCTGTKKHSLIFHPLSLGGTPPPSPCTCSFFEGWVKGGGEVFSFSGAVTGSLSGMCLGASLISSTAPPLLQASFVAVGLGPKPPMHPRCLAPPPTPGDTWRCQKSHVGASVGYASEFQLLAPGFFGPPCRSNV